jgi:hypothetical protein
MMDRLANGEDPEVIKAELQVIIDRNREEQEEQDHDAYGQDMVPYRSNYASETRALLTKNRQRANGRAQRLIDHIDRGFSCNREMWDEDQEKWTPVDSTSR